MRARTHARVHKRQSNKMIPIQKKMKNIFFYLRRFLSLDAHACTHARTCARAPKQKDDSNTKKIKNNFFTLADF